MTIAEGVQSGDGAVTITYAVARSPASSAPSVGAPSSLPTVGGRTGPTAGLAMALVALGAVALAVVRAGRRRSVSETP